MVATRSQRAAAVNNFDLLDDVDEAFDNQANLSSHTTIKRDYGPSHVLGTESSCSLQVLEEIEDESKSSEMRSYVIIVILAVVTYTTYPGTTFGNNTLEPTMHTVFYYGWISATSTGFGSSLFQ